MKFRTICWLLLDVIIHLKLIHEHVQCFQFFLFHNHRQRNERIDVVNTSVNRIDQKHFASNML